MHTFIQVPILSCSPDLTTDFEFCFHEYFLFKVSESLKTLQFLSHYYMLQKNAIFDCPFKVCFIGDFLDCNTIPYVANKILFLMEPLNLFYG